jgi:hypothetical protein
MPLPDLLARKRAGSYIGSERPIGWINSSSARAIPGDRLSIGRVNNSCSGLAARFALPANLVKLSPKHPDLGQMHFFHQPHHAQDELPRQTPEKSRSA